MFEVQRLGMVAYHPTWQKQRELVRAIDEGQAVDQLLLLEHPHTITLGRGSDWKHLLLSTEAYQAQGIDVVEIDRGGDVTYHGPGQLVGYPLFRLVDAQQDAHMYLRSIEEALILALQAFGIQAGRMEAHTGVWVNDEKVASIGVKFHKARHGRGYITSHGFALNVNTDLRYFTTIVPCGISAYSMTSMAQLLGEEVAMEQVCDQVEQAMRTVFTTKRKPQ
jgi:lipoyl(octanoyl) transferase